MLNVQSTPLKGLFLIEPETVHDMRGLERGGFHPTQYAAFGLTGRFSSDKFFRGFQGSLRGLYILPEDRHLLLTLIRGDITIVAVETRPHSRQFGKVHIVDISDAQQKQIYLTGGMAYGLCVRSECADWHEKYAGLVTEDAVEGIYWQDRDLNISWPVKFPLVSDHDAAFPPLSVRVKSLPEKVRP
jgi:dTDP-4-dehydrorhamnose 3,5-epimerase